MAENKKFAVSEEDEKTKKPYKQAKKKVCAFCTEKVEYIDYKDVNRLKKYITEKVKILQRRQTGVCAKHQRELQVAIKRARNMALISPKGE